MGKKKKTPRKSRPIRSKKARVQKKQVTRASEERLRKAGLSSTQIKDLPAYVRTDPEKVERIARTQELLDYGLSPSIISRADLASKDLKPGTLKDWRTRGQKLDELERLGITDFTAADLRLSWPKLMEKYPGVEPPAGYKIRGTSGNKAINSGLRWTGKTYLYIGAAEVHTGFVKQDLSGLSDLELIQRINTKVADKLANPSGSDELHCIYQVFIGSQADCERMASYYFSSGYNMNALRLSAPKGRYIKTVKERYQKITISNSYTQREFHEMIYTCLCQMLNEHVADFMDDMRDFCDRNGFPFMKNL